MMTSLIQTGRSPRIKQQRVDLHKRQTCRTCNMQVVEFLDFGYMPLAGAFLEPNTDLVEFLYPMQVSFCATCTLVQIPNVISKDVFFNESYHYLSSVTSTLNSHFEEYANFLQELTAKFSRPVIFEFGCNDGVLLSKLKDKGIDCVGMDASANVVEIARGRGLEVLPGFFDVEAANELLETRKPPAVITGSNVFAHNDDVEKILEGVQVLLDRDGYFIVEVHYLLDLINELQFDFFYHEHCNYYSLRSIIYLLNKFGLEVVDVQRLNLHSGSIRVVSKFKEKANVISGNVPELLRREDESGLGSVDTYERFAGRVKAIKEKLVSVLEENDSEGKRICGYGASGRATTLLNYLGVDGIIKFMVDESPVRANHLLPGLHIPILPRENFELEKPAVCLITAYPYASEIMRKENWFLSQGGAFILPLPEVEVIRN